MNPVVHFELPIFNPRRAKAFYEKAFGWGIKEWEGGYWMAQTTKSDKMGRSTKPGTMNGGLMKGKKGDMPVIVVGVKSIVSDLKKVVKAGGKVVMDKMSMGDMGYYARVKDSEGNVIGMWQAK
jgi:predicted enzyme related to lactoylglutathione lyase